MPSAELVSETPGDESPAGSGIAVERSTEDVFATEITSVAGLTYADVSDWTAGSTATDEPAIQLDASDEPPVGVTVTENLVTLYGSAGEPWTGSAGTGDLTDWYVSAAEPAPDAPVTDEFTNVDVLALTIEPPTIEPPTIEPPTIEPPTAEPPIAVPESPTFSDADAEVTGFFVDPGVSTFDPLPSWSTSTPATEPEPVRAFTEVAKPEPVERFRATASVTPAPDSG